VHNREAHNELMSIIDEVFTKLLQMVQFFLLNIAH